ncbi:hypothetical protein NBRC116594_09790 [Shimia sp. NS0008-38b]|uniref:hypothetical protein n=1 Tax=Shimia sp. NS0008-38b TaxID=3127653 RepID=UPI0031073788
MSRQSDDADGRAFRVSLTPEGDAVLAKFERVVQAVQSRILPALSDRAKARLLALMTKVLNPVG